MAIIKLENGIKTSVTDTVLQYSNTSRRGEVFRGTLILADGSGSMNEVMPGGQTRHQCLVAAIKDVWQEGFGLIQFNDGSKIVTGGPGRLPYPGGGTYLFDTLKIAMRFPLKKLIVISDGAVSDDEKTLRTAKSITCPISCLFIGDESETRGIEFLRRLSNPPGSCTIHDLRKELANTLAPRIKGLLA